MNSENKRQGNRNKRPLGKILHIIDREAIVKPNTPYINKNARVFLDTDKEIGYLGDPFGSVTQPYLPIRLNTAETNIVGKSTFASMKKKKRKKDKKQHRNRYPLKKRNDN